MKKRVGPAQLSNPGVFLLRLSSVVIVAVLGMATDNFCGAALIGDFENGSLDGWEPTPFQSYTPVLTSVAGVGNTLHQSSLAVDNNANDFWGVRFDLMGNGFLNDFVAAKYLMVDVTFRGDGRAHPPDIQTLAAIDQIALNDSRGDFSTAVPTVAGAGVWVNGDQVQTVAFDLDTLLFHTRTGAENVTYGAFANMPYRLWLQDYLANPQPVADGPLSHVSFWMKSLSGGGGGASAPKGRIYIDNIRLVVPEPASLVLIGLAASAVWIRGRRRFGS